MTIFGTDALVLSSNTDLPWETDSRWKDVQGAASYYKSQYLDWSNDAAWISWLNGATDLSGQTGDISISYTPKYVSWNRNMGQSRGADSVIKTGYELEVNVTMPVLGADWEELNSFWPNTTTQTHDEVSGTEGSEAAPSRAPCSVFVSPVAAGRERLARSSSRSDAGSLPARLRRASHTSTTSR